ncbi:MAG: hypothetical protein WAR01_09100, partial [Dokdonella sp.]|uniref:hypothetical protein n=1 Tax=Dokdonella sp. TaxID=2291710 RepID=UPI003BB0327E
MNQTWLDTARLLTQVAPLVRRNGRCLASLTLHICPVSARSCTTWSSCRRPMQKDLPRSSASSLRDWPRYPKRRLMMAHA